jgi:diketogulonate reductase-like aldo/keto reductase
VQNRCYADRGWDQAIRQFCAENGIGYQGFSLLTANRDVVTHPYCQQLATRYGRTTTAIIFRFALDIGMIPLTGTTNPEHMRDDLKVTDFHLTPDEVSRIERLTAP